MSVNCVTRQPYIVNELFYNISTDQFTQNDTSKQLN